MNRFRKWGLSVLTMVSVATAVLLVTGWGSALASSVGSLNATQVLVTNTTTNPAYVKETGTVPVSGSLGITGTPTVKVSGTPTVTGSVGITGTPTVRVGNLQAAPTTQYITHLTGTVNANGEFTLVPQWTDVRAYRSVTLYLSFPSSSGLASEDCRVYTLDPDNIPIQIDEFTAGNGQDYYSTTYNPAPPYVGAICDDTSGEAQDYDVMLTGRTG